MEEQSGEGQVFLFNRRKAANQGGQKLGQSYPLFIYFFFFWVWGGISRDFLKIAMSSE